jgi:hypothetical protein
MAGPGFAELLDAVDQLPEGDQRTLVEIVQRRLAEAGRARIIHEAEEARLAYLSGEIQGKTASEIMDATEP